MRRIQVVDQIGTGHFSLERLDYILARHPTLLEAVAQRFPEFDSAKAKAYPVTYKDFTGGKTSIVLNTGGTSLMHLSELKDLNTYDSRIPGTKAYQRYQNKVQTLSTELARFYAGGTQPNIPEVAGIEKTLNATFNRDAAIETQAQSMGDKLDNYETTWKNAAPSPAYQAPMPNISAAAKAARAKLDPEYAKRVGGGQQGGAGNQGGGIQVRDPQGGVHTFADQASADRFKKLANIQ